MLKHVAVSPHRARADSVSLASSTSCCSLGSLDQRHDSISELSQRTILTALSFYGTGSYQRPIGDIGAHSLAQQTVSSVINEVTRIIDSPEMRRKYIHFPHNLEERNKIRARYKYVIEDKRTGGHIINKKKEAWKAITTKYNSNCTTGPRQTDQLKALYDNMKQKSRKNVGENNKLEYMNTLMQNTEDNVIVTNDDIAKALKHIRQDKTTIKVYARRLRPDIEYKTLSVTWGTRAREVVNTLLGKFRMRHRDPRLFYLSMEVRVRAAGLKTTLELDDDARPAALQACHPKGYSKFSLEMRPGGLVKIYDSALMSSSKYKSLLISEQTTADELLAILLHCYDSSEGVERFSLYEVCPSQEYERKLHPDDLPLLVKRSWPADNDCHFRVRRNPRAPPLPPRTLPAPQEPASEEDEPSRALSALSLESDAETTRYRPVYKFPSITYCRETKNDYLYI